MESAFVISLDFELRWGVMDRCPPGGAYEANVLGARRVIPRLVDLFEESGVRATWATVGFLFASSRDELEAYIPEARPVYEASHLNTYAHQPGVSESADPMHYGGSLVSLLASAPGQEVASHTFSHYFCNEAGQTADTFRADLQAARSIALSRGIDLRSIVFPRNQHNPVYDPILAEEGFSTYRGNPPGWLWEFSNTHESSRPLKRGARLLHNYANLSGSTVVPWKEIPQRHGLSDVRASAFLKPYSRRLGWADGLRLRRIRENLVAAARTGGVYHLWFHPHNFGVNQDENLSFMRAIIDVYRECADRFGMRSLSMYEAGKVACGETFHSTFKHDSAPHVASVPS
jgi:peptidoglycan/xylan/chitin deacetylase (PgdA/CDA1 family)